MHSSPSNRDVFLEALGSAMSPDIIVTGEDIPEHYHSDWSGLSAVRPLALARPRTTQEVSQIVQLCNEHGIIVVPQGGLTGLAGGAQPRVDGIVMSLDRMNRVLEIDPLMATITVEAGVTLDAVHAAAEGEGLQFSVDLGSRGSCTVGGILSTNAGGVRVIRYGMTRENVLGIEVVLPDGTIVTSLNKLLKNNAGYDLKQIFLGAEGTLGIITRAVLRLQPKPVSVSTALCGSSDFGSICSLLRLARSELSSTLTSFEVMWPNFFDFMTDSLPELRRPLAGRHGIYAIIEVSATRAGESSALLSALLERSLQEGLVEDAVVAKSAAETDSIWAIRDSGSEYGRVMGPINAFDVGLPTDLAGECVEHLDTELRKLWGDVIFLSYGHVGDSNLHLICNVPSHGDNQPYAEISRLIYGAIGERGGTVSAEHGIGLLKLPYLPMSRSVEELDLMKTIKGAIDRNNIMNVGKVFK